jgi:hypothetical protein
VTLAISVFGEDTDDGIARVGEITSVIAVERPDVWFDVGRIGSGPQAEEFESARPVHRLRGFALYCEREGRAPTVDEAAAGYPLLEQLYDGKIATEWYPHLVDHADDDGYYIPADFPKPVNSFLDGEVMSIGSAHRLLAEMNSIERFMSEDEAFALERRIWSVLRTMAKNAVDGNLVIRFRLSNPDFD